MAKLFLKWVKSTVLVLALVSATTGVVIAEEYKDEIRPGYARVMADAVLVRPFTFIGMILGSVVWLITTPITAATGTIGEAGQTLVVDPAMTTFVRCLGCTDTGWRNFPSE